MTAGKYVVWHFKDDEPTPPLWWNVRVAESPGQAAKAFARGAELEGVDELVLRVRAPDNRLWSVTVDVEWQPDFSIRDVEELGVP